MTIPRMLSERYELGDTLGYGGMSEVHRGRDVRLGREVAVKVLRADLSRDPQFQLRFRREAQNAAALNHPAIVAVYDTGETDSEFGPLPYIVMEFVDGQTLREIVKTSGPFSQQRVLEVMADVCAALDFSHRHGIIHRDVKPANVMINGAGAVKVMDFGIARALADGQNMTQTAAVIGTAQYLSPEQARGEAVDARSDVYAAGCVVFELLTGEPPFSGDSPVAVAYQHVREDPRRPSEVSSDVPPELDAVVLKAMSKNPANRYQSAAEMRADLVRVLRGQRPLAPQVMSDEERTSLYPAGMATASTRRMEAPPTRHTASAAWADEERPRRSTAKVVAVGLSVAALLAIVAFVATQLFGGPAAAEQVTVPNVAGQQQEPAREALSAAGLRPSIQREPSSPEEVGEAIRTDPAAGEEVDANSEVTLYIGTGPAQVTVPDVTGKSAVEADQLLQASGLSLAVDRRTAPTQDPSLVDKVIAQDPQAGETVPGQTPVTITVGVRQETVRVPNLIGQQQSDAEEQLRGLGLQSTFSKVDGPGEPGTVIQTIPGPGQSVPVGGSVELQISRGNLVRMPDLRGLTVEEARRALRDAGYEGDVEFSGRPVPDPSQDDRVVSQSVPAGQGIEEDQRISVSVGEYDPDASDEEEPDGGG